MSKENTPSSERTHASAESGESVFSLQPGAVILDRYVVAGLLGTGGMGSVFHVRHLHLQTDYALKVLNHQGRDSLWKRFANEARAASKLDHPNLTKVYDSGLLPDGNPFFIMELVKGESLADLLKKKGRLPVHKVLKIFIQVGFALSYAHEAGVVHRDLKPSNIMLAKSEGSSIGIIKVVDLGIAKLTGRDEFNQQTLTRTGEIIGSPLYMSPEQCVGAPVDGRADLYSFGCAMYEALTGAPPLIGENALATMMKHQSEKPLSLKEASMGEVFPKALEVLVARILEKDPEARYSNAQLMTADLVRIEQDLQGDESEESKQVSSNSISENSPKRSPLVQSDKPINLIVPMLTFLMGIAAMALFQNCVHPTKEKKEIERHAEFDSPSVLSPNRVAAYRPNDNRTKSPEYFSKLTNIGRVRQFHFGAVAKDKYGLISLKDGIRVPAVGTVNFPSEKAIYFWPSSKMINNEPDGLRRFRPEELGGLCINDEITTNFNIVKVLPLFTNLKSLRLEMNVDDSYLRYIDQLPSLECLDVSNSMFTGAKLVKLKRFRKLQLLNCACIEGKDAILKELPYTRLKNMKLEGLDLNGLDLLQIAKVKTLNELYIGGNPQIDDEALRHLANHPNLTHLDISACSVTARSFKTFLSLKNLIYLKFSKEQITKKELIQLRSQLKKCSVQD